MKLLLRLGTKEFQSGISQMGAHAERGGVFYKASGVTPLFGAGSSVDVNNGLLMAGAGGTALSYGSVTGVITRIIPDNGLFYTGGGFICATSAHEIVKVQISDTSTPTFGALTIERTISGQTLTPGIVVFKSSAGTRFLIYRQAAQIGIYESGGGYDDDWGPSASGIVTDYFGAMHIHYGLNKVIFGNGAGKIGTISNSITTTPMAGVTTSALTFDADSYASAISDDGVYVVAAITRNSSADSNLLIESRIIYWDGSTTTGFIRDYPITDPLIYSLEKTPNGLFAYGVTGIWQVSLDGVKKVFNHNPGVYTVSGASVIHYGKGATGFFSDALVWGGNLGSTTTRVMKSLGKLDSGASNAFLNPVLLTTNKNITAINAQILKGYVFVGDSTPQIKYYPIGSGTPQTSISAQTVYFQLPTKHQITYVDVVFGEPLVSGDSMSIQLQKDEDTAVTPTTALTATFADDGAIRRKRVKFTNYVAESQLSLTINFTAGAVKIKRIDVYGSPVPNAAD